MPHTHIAGSSRLWLPDISATITIAVIGMRIALARKPAMPTSANAAGWMPNDAGRTRAKKSPTAAPSVPPHTSAGANTPPDPPEPTVNAVAMAFMKKKQTNPAMVNGPKSTKSSLSPAVKLSCMTE